MLNMILEDTADCWNHKSCLFTFATSHHM